MLVFKTEWQRANWLPLSSSHHNRKNASSGKLPSPNARPAQVNCADPTAPQTLVQRGTDLSQDRGLLCF